MNFPTLKASTIITALLSAALLTGCGGGSGSATPPSSTTTAFPIQKAMSNMYTSGFTKTSSVTGTATVKGISYPFTGSLQVNETLANANATFNGQAAQEESVSATGTVTINGQTINIGSVAQYNLYQTSTNIVLGITTPNSYCIVQSSSGYPTSATVGQSGTVATVSCYADSTKTTLTGSETINFAVTAGTSSSTATVTLTFANYDPAGQEIASIQANYSVDTSGNFNVLSSTYNVTIGGVQVNFTAL